MDITPEMVTAWRTLQEFARTATHNSLNSLSRSAAQAIDVLDNSNFMVPIEEAGECGDTSAPLPEPACDLDKPCPVHDQPDPAEWGDTTREDMAAHQIGLPTLAPGEEVRPAFSDTHPRAARELGDAIQMSGRLSVSDPVDPVTHMNGTHS